MKTFFLGAFLCAVGLQIGVAQGTQLPRGSTFNRDGRWSLGFRGGANMWFNDFDKRKISGGGDMYIRYGFTRKFSLGIMGSYDVLQANQKELFPGTPLQFAYIEDKGISADLVAWFHFVAGTWVSPYLYLGAGGYQYKRKVTGGGFYPLNKNYRSLHVPVGFGLDVMVSKNVGFSLDAGARFMDDLTDSWKGNTKGSTEIGVFDWYATGKAGLIFYFGSSESDDDDADGLTNGNEEKLGTDPNNADTDGDGLIDGDEVNIYKTDAKKADSDDDGLSDAAEVKAYRTDPNKPDTDGDGLNDGKEVTTFYTDPLRLDSDGDNLTDGDEVLIKKTDPANPDTDGDALNDGDEIYRKTDPLRADTDGGTVNDGQEVARGSNPLDANDDVPKPKLEVGKAIILEGIVFKTGKAVIEPESESTLMDAFTTLKDNPEISVEIRGYTDSVGKLALNMRLSQRRAEAVQSWLVYKGIDSRRISAKGFGPSIPLGDNKTAEGRQKNRRIEFFRSR